MSSVSNGLYFLTLPLVSFMRVIYRKICRARYLYIKRNVEKVWGARYILGVNYLSKNTVLSDRTQNFYYHVAIKPHFGHTFVSYLYKIHFNNIHQTFRSG